MRTCSPSSVSRRRSNARSWIHSFHAVVAIGALGAILLPMTAEAYPQTRQGFFMGVGLAKGSAALDTGGATTDRQGGGGGSFRLGYVLNPRFALGMESNSWVTTGTDGAVALSTLTAAVTLFPVEGLVLRGGIGGGGAAGVGDGLAGEVGVGLTAGAAYEFRVARSFAIGPQIDYSKVSLSYVDYNFINIGLSMNWYFIPK